MSQPSSFIQNTNYLARNIHLLERGEELLTPAAVRALTKALDAPLGTIVEDIKKGVSDRGNRKLDISTAGNYIRDPSSVEYSAISITGSDPAFVVRHEVVPSHKPRDILNAVREAIVAYNAVAEAQETTLISDYNTELVLSTCEEGGHGWLVRITDAADDDSLLSWTLLSNIKLHVAENSLTSAVAPSIDYYWHKSTSSFLLSTSAVELLSQAVRRTTQQAHEALMSAQASAQSAAESEASRQASESAQAASEYAQRKSEEAQVASEVAQDLAESAQEAAEDAQAAAEVAQGLSEDAQEAAEQAQSSAEDAQSMAEQAATNSEASRQASETAASESLQSSQNADSAAGAAAQAKLGSQTAQGLSEQARDAAVIAQGVAEDAASASALSAQASSDSADIATTKAGEASDSANDAEAALQAAQAIELAQGSAAGRNVGLAEGDVPEIGDDGLVVSSAGFVIEGAAAIPADVLEFLQGANYTALLALLGGVPKAPEDGETYAMKDGEWVALALPTP